MLFIIMTPPKNNKRIHRVLKSSEFRPLKKQRYRVRIALFNSCKQQLKEPPNAKKNQIQVFVMIGI